MSHVGLPGPSVPAGPTMAESGRRGETAGVFGRGADGGPDLDGPGGFDGGETAGQLLPLPAGPGPHHSIT
jgi:hypothetical protein